MINRTTLYRGAAVTVLGLLAGCGGSSNSVAPAPTTPTPPPTGGISRNGIAIGPISTFGSVVVNGVRYETDASTVFVIDGEAGGSQADLRVGDTVTITATLDEDSGTATATRITYDDVVTGPAQSIDIASNTLVVLGQTVRVTADTSFDDDFAVPSLDGISVGQILEISGSVDSDGSIVATRIEFEPAGTELEVTGVVAALNSAAQTFTLGNLQVDFSNAMLSDFPNGVISDGDFVEAKGSQLGANNELIASEVELERLFPDAEEDDFAEIEGFVTRFVSIEDFDVANFPVVTNAQTVFQGGTAADIGLNVKLEVEGVINANGALVANEVEIRAARSVRVSAAVDSVDAANNTVIALGIPIRVDALTRLEDKTDADVDPLALADINTGDFIEVRGGENPAGSGQVLAAIFEREDPDDTEVQGFVESITDPAFTILGVNVETNASTVFRDENDVVISRI
ncbi:MAG: DUF5666 domain-containing protein, partial [Gammaproteobacteria bacterium]